MKKLIYLVLLVFSCNSLLAQDFSFETIPVDSIPREYIAFFPPGFDLNNPKPLPVVLNFHGSNSFDYQQAVYTDFQQVAMENNFIVVYPNSITSLS